MTTAPNPANFPLYGPTAFNPHSQQQQPRSTMPFPPPPPQQQQQQTLRPVYFISRTNGIMTPLIAVDELPFNVRLQGVSRVMRMEDTLGMQHVGMAGYTGMVYQLEKDIYVGSSQTLAADTGGESQGQGTQHMRSQSGGMPTTKFLAPDALARQAMAQSASNAAAVHSNGSIDQPRPLSAHETATNWRSTFNPPTNPFNSSATPPPSHNHVIKPILTKPLPASTAPTTTPSTARTQTLIDAILATTSGASEAARIGYVPKPTVAPPSGAIPDAEKKEFCTYWIRTGECDYTQQGCLYKHEMPDRAGLERIGFRTVPRWWAERQSLLKLIGGGEKVSLGGGDGKGRERERGVSVGPVVKSEVWLKKGREGDDGDESEASDEEGEVSEAESASSAGSRKIKWATKVTDLLQKPLEAEPSGTIDLHDEGEVDAVAQKATVKLPRKPSETRAPPPSPIDLRKASTTSDLIDLAAPLLPTPSSSTPSLSPASSADSSPKLSTTAPLTPPTPLTPAFIPLKTNTTPVKPEETVATKPEVGTKKAATTPPSTNRVFVPKGESPDHHIAEVRKRQTRQHVRRGAPGAAIGTVVPLEKQIQEVQKAKALKQPRGHGQEKEKEKEKGLMASQHAPKSAADTVGQGMQRPGEVKPQERMEHAHQQQPKRSTKTGCRIRRPASAPKVINGGGVAPVKILRKGEKVDGDGK